MPQNENSSPGLRGAATTTADATADDETIIRIGLKVQAWGANLAEHGRIRRQLTRAQCGAANARLVAIARGFQGELDTLIIGLRAEAVKDIDGA